MIFFLDFKTTIKVKLGGMLEKLTESQTQWEQVRIFDVNQDDVENKNCASTQSLRIQKNQLIELQEQLE